ncbi:M56 family metallopeptidase [Sphingobacterium sp. xlx-130]|uniref:M56 family metallopeptidase n=1 Tax=Sphingobacterium sp. xlx-130 TaxID=2654323 RepID=UPI0013DBF3B8|nr:M56 family metallopeptidase [Sphingobacterium sp. xlx-130]
MEALISSISTALGWSLLHSLWQGAAIYLILFGLFLTIPELKAATKHNLALTAQIAVFTSFAYTFFNLLDYASLSNSYSTMPLDNKTLFYMDYFQEAGPTVQQYFIYIVPLYLLGILAQSILCVNSYLRIKNLKRLSTFAVPLTWQQRFYDGIVSLGITKNVKLFLSESIYEPLAMGFFKPVIIFPVAYVNKMSLSEVEAILLHELTHIKRNDYLLNMINIVLETILFFNPFIWLMSRHTRTEREQACDDSVIKLLPERTLYAKALLNVELLKQDANSVRMTLAATGTKHKLLHRIKRITQVKMETPYTNIKHQLLASLMVIFTLVSVAWVQPETNDVAERKATSLTEITNITNELDTIAHVKQEINLEHVTNLSAPCTTNTTTGKTIVSQQDTNKINQSFREKFESPQWQAHILKIEENAQKIEEKFNSPEWKAHVAKIEENARKIEEKFNSQEWKAHVAKIEENARKIEEKFNSPEWKAHVAKIEENAKKIEEKFNSPEWKAHIAKIEENARKIEEKFNSPEWKEKFKQNDQ